MASSASTTGQRVLRWFGVDDPWERPAPPVGRADVVLAALMALFGLGTLELVRSVGALEEVTYPWGLQWLAVVTGAALLVARRHWPLTVASGAALHMLVVGIAMPMIMGQFTLQVIYFVAFMSAVAWARDRRWMVVVVGIIVLVMFVWLALQFTVGTALQDLVDETQGNRRFGVIAPVPAAVLLTVLINAVYFGGAVLTGRNLWSGARQNALLTEAAETITTQADELRTRAVTEERLRIARELHDVVAHHVSVIGIQAAAARRVMGRDPDAAGRALEGIEGSSREAVSSMRGLLGTLREVERSTGSRATAAGGAGRAPQPTLADLPALVESFTTPTRTASFDLVESDPGTAQQLPAALAHSIHRTVQEALTNVEKHSTAARVSVVLRLEVGDRGFAEVEVVDDGRPRPGTSGSGLGQLGIRERAASHRGTVEVGPRPTGGYRVRVRFPWGDAAERPSADPEPRGPGLRSVS